jgi:hypothetical protein
MEDHVFVDFSCGDNRFIKRLKENNITQKCIAYDLDPKVQDEVIKKDWFEVHEAELASRTIIGLNPPYGKRGVQARKFIAHASSFKPSYMLLIIPFFQWMPKDYITVYEEDLEPFYDTPEGKLVKVGIPTHFVIWKHAAVASPNVALTFKHTLVIMLDVWMSQIKGETVKRSELLDEEMVTKLPHHYLVMNYTGSLAGESGFVFNRGKWDCIRRDGHVDSKSLFTIVPHNWMIISHPSLNSSLIFALFEKLKLLKGVKMSINRSILSQALCSLNLEGNA